MKRDTQWIAYNDKGMLDMHTPGGVIVTLAGCILAILLGATVALAGEPAACIIGAMSAVGLSATDGADVVLQNRFTGGDEYTTCTMTVDGLVIGVLWHGMPGAEPDTVTITPPPGYAAFPPQITIPEDEDYVIAIRAIPLG